MANQTLTPDVRDILERSTITERQLVLPQGQLPRPLYEAVNKAITFAGGKWNRSARAHVFQGDPRQKLGLMLETGVAVDEKKRDQAFFTPPELANRLAEVANVKGCEVLEPSAGLGALADACREAGAGSITLFEINPERAKSLEDKYAFDVHCVDFLSILPNERWSIVKDGIGYHTPFNRIVMNPPFTKGQDIKHVAHALKWLQPGGCLVSVMLDNQTRPKFQTLIAGREHVIESVPAGAFKQSGTNIATIILSIQG